MVQPAYYCMTVNGVFLAIMLLAADAVPSLVVTSAPEPYCPGPVLFTCIATDISVVLRWEINDNTIGDYTFNPTDQYPLNLNVTSPLIDSIQVINATLDGNSLNIISTLRVSDVSVLNGSSIHCEDLVQRESNEANISVFSLAPPPVAAPNCSLLPSSGGPEVILQWSDVFNRDHAVDKYRVSMSPSLPSCPNTLEVWPDQDYTCSGLEIGQQYNISFTAFNCQQGEAATYSFQLEAPNTPIGVSLVNTDSLQWMEVANLSFSVNCTFDNTASYLVIVQDNIGEMITNKTVFSESCENGVCSTTIPSSDRNCRVTVRASNLFGESDNADFVIILGSVKYTSTNIALMVIGLIMWFLALGICVVTLVWVIKKDSSNKYLSVNLLCFGALLLVVSLCVWVATGAHVEQQEDTCDPSWQSIRNGLIIAAFVISFIALLVVLIISIIESFKHSKSCHVKKVHNSETRNKPESKDDNGPSQDKIDLRKPPSTPDSAALNMNETTLAESIEETEAEPADFFKVFTEKPSDANERLGLYTDKTKHEEEEKPVTSLCTSMLVYNKQKPSGEQVASWFPDYRRWPQKELNKSNPLKVYFLNNCPWKHGGNKIKHVDIVKFLKDTWKCFTKGQNKEDSHIRVYFDGTSIGSWSVIGSLAVDIPPDNPTMVLNFNNLSGNEILDTIVHQFGHALGLGHTLMEPNTWKILKSCLDQRAMMEHYGSSTMEDFVVQWTGKGLNKELLNRDPESIMRYRTHTVWLRVLPGKYSTEFNNCLKLFHQHTISSEKLSEGDTLTLQEFMTKMKEEDLVTLEDKFGNTFSLMDRVQSEWKIIGINIGMKSKELNAISKNYHTNAERLKTVWNEWFKSGHFPTWDNLKKLLKDIGHEKVSREYFEFLARC